MQGRLGNVVSSYILNQNIINKESRKMATDVKLAVSVTGGYILSNVASCILLKSIHSIVCQLVFAYFLDSKVDPL